MQYEISCFIKIHIKVFYFQNLFNCETLLLFFSNKNHGLLRKKTLYRKKKFFSADYVKIVELHVVHTWRHMQSE